MSPKHRLTANLFFAALLACVFVTGCGVGSAFSGTPPGAASLAGNWEFGAVPVAATPPAVAIPIGIYLTANGSVLSGTPWAQIPVPQSCQGSCCGGPFANIHSPLSGAIDTQGNLKLQSAPSAPTVFSLTGQVIFGSLGNGTYTISGACTGQGSISGSHIPALTGTWAGVLKSSSKNNSFRVSLTLRQTTAPDASGFLHFSGSAVFTGSPCFTTAAIPVPTETNSHFLGNLFSAGLTAPDGSSISIAGNLSSSGTSLTVSYAVSGGGCNQDLGAGTLTIQ